MKSGILEIPEVLEILEIIELQAFSLHDSIIKRSLYKFDTKGRNI